MSNRKIKSIVIISHVIQFTNQNLQAIVYKLQAGSGFDEFSLRLNVVNESVDVPTCEREVLTVMFRDLLRYLSFWH